MILVISDYHKRENAVLDLINQYRPDYTLCLGDGESEEGFYKENNIISVKGNCDYTNLPLIKVIEIDGMRILMTHGHLHNVYFDIFKLYLLAKEQNATHVLYGHTHMPIIEDYEGVIFVNPGALKDGNYAIIDNNEIVLK